MLSYGSDFNQIIIFSVVAAAIILIRCAYRLCARCKIHRNCSRTWHADDAWMAFALVPLVLRAVFLCLSFAYGKAPAGSKTASPDHVVMSRKFLIPGRLFYGLLLWTAKFALLSFYRRFAQGKEKYERLATALWWFLLISYLAILPPTLLECRPLNVFWAAHPSGTWHCRQGLGNLVTMAALNILTDIVLIVFPIPLVWSAPLEKKKKLVVLAMFSLGFVVVIITIVRLPLIISDGVSQSTRSLWASIEILGSIMVANAAFYYAWVRDWLTETHANRGGSLEVGSASIVMPDEEKVLAE